MKDRGQRFAALFSAWILCTTLGGHAVAQNEIPSLTTDDIVTRPDATTNAVAAATTAAAKTVASTKPATPGYVRVETPTGYSFERPQGWTAVENLTAKGAPASFAVDAIFQDAKTGSVVTAISVDRTKLQTPVDIGKDETVSNLLTTMLSGGDPKSTVKIVKQDMGKVPASELYWVRVKAEGMGQSTDGKPVPTTYWVQMSQTPKLLALIAVGYPTDQKMAAVLAYHTVRTLEIANESGTSPTTSAPGQPPAAPGKKNSAGGVRRPQ